jgi:hypothetical protein
LRKLLVFALTEQRTPVHFYIQLPPEWQGKWDLKESKLSYCQLNAERV